MDKTLSPTPAAASAEVAGLPRTLYLDETGVHLLDQTALPHTVRYVALASVAALIEAIRTMIVRGAPAIGIAGAYGVVLSARAHAALPDAAEFSRRLRDDAGRIRDARPTAVNLQWAVDRLLSRLDVLLAEGHPPGAIAPLLAAEAQAIFDEDVAGNRRMGAYGATLLARGARVLTHCNAGALATAGYGTALGVIRAAFEQDPTVTVYADETRPRLQGARLTTWELVQSGIPVTLLTDGMAGSLMRAGQVDCVVVGADRIAANGDTANKIGTYTLSVLAKAHNIPFYVAAPLSTIDLALDTGDAIPIEERDPSEVFEIHGERLCAEGTRFYNPAFDVTPAANITAIITEAGIARPEYPASLRALFAHSAVSAASEAG